MYETVKIVKGIEIKRLKGSRRFYHIDLGGGRFITFLTIKEAVSYIEANF